MGFSLGSNAQLGIGIAISLQDRFSGKAAQINKQIASMRKESNDLAMGAVRDYRNQSAQIATGAAAITYGLYNAAKASSEFQHKINQVYIVGGKSLQKTRDQLEDFSRGLSHTFAIAPTDIAGAMFENTKAGVNKGLEEITKYQLAVGKATDEQVQGNEGVASTLLGIANAYDVNISKQGEFAKVANAVTAVANASMSSVRDLGESMQYAGFTAHQFGMSYEQTLALLGTLSQAGIRGSSAGTALNNMIQYLGAAGSQFASKKQKETLAALGIKPGQLRGLMDKGDMFGASQLLFQASSGLGPSDRTKLLQNLTNMRGLRGLEGSWLQGGDISKTPAGMLQSALQGEKSDISITQAKDMQKDIYTQTQFFENSMKEVGISFVKAVTPFLSVALPILTKGARIFGKILESPIGEFFSTIVAVGAPLIALLFGWRTMVLTATIALKGFTDTLRVGGYKGLVGAGLNQAGTGFWKYGTSKLPSGVKMASNGRLYAAEAFEHEGVMYKKGFLPNAFSEKIGYKGAGVGIGKGIGTGIGAIAGGMGAAQGSGIIAGWLSEVAPALGTAVGFLGELLPIVGAIIGIYSIVKAIWGDDQSDKAKYSDQQASAIRADYFSRLYGNMEDPNYKTFAKNYQKQNNKQPFNLTVVTNVDGRQVQSQQINDTVDNTIAKQFETNLYGH